MDENTLVNQMLAMGGHPPEPAPTGVTTDPAPQATTTEGTPAAPAATPTEGAPQATSAQAEPTGTPPAEGTPAPAAAPAPVKSVKEATPAAEPTPVNLEDTFDKPGKAFAAQRLQIKQQNDLMMRFAQIAKINAATPEEAFQKLTGIVTAEEAKTRNIDPAVLRTLQDQEAKLAAYEQEEIKKAANASFVDLQKQFELEPRELEAFARQLSKEGINPFATANVDLTGHYLKLNWERLVEKRVAAQVETRVNTEVERRMRVAQSTTPPAATAPATGQPQAAPKPATPRDEMEAFRRVLGLGSEI